MRTRALTGLTVMGLALASVASTAVSAAPVTTDTATAFEEEDDDDFPWGLLGLLGLAGLLGMKRRDDHVHVDHNRTGTRTDNRL